MVANISKILRVHMKIFKIFGFCNLSLHDNFQRNQLEERWLICWSFLLIIGFNIITLLTLISDDDFLFLNDTFGYFNDVLKMVFADIAVTVSYLETVCRRLEFYKFWKVYNCLQKRSNNEKNVRKLTSNELWENRRFLAIFYGNCFVECIIMILFVFFQPMTRHLVLFSIVFTPFVYFVHLRNMQFIFYIEILRIELEKLQQDLGLMVDYSRFAAYGCGFRRFEEFLRKQLVDKQTHYQMIYEMFEHFQNGFGYSIITVMLMNYVNVLVDAYFGYYTIYRDWNKTGMFVKCKGLVVLNDVNVNYRNTFFDTSLCANSSIFNYF